jgi:hypothetical protein
MLTWLLFAVLQAGEACKLCNQCWQYNGAALRQVGRPDKTGCLGLLVY